MSAKETLFRELTPTAGGDDRASAQSALRERIAALSFGHADASVDLFLARAREAGSEAHRCGNPEEAAAMIAELCAQTRSVIIAADALTARMALRERIAERGCEVLGLEEGESTVSREQYAAADAGVTVAHAGIADSGAILISSSQNESRSVSLLPVRHIAVLPATRILPSLLQAAPLLRTQTAGSSAATLVGGPSKTADIEKVLVTGVHGPAVLTIIVIDSID